MFYYFDVGVFYRVNLFHSQSSFLHLQTPKDVKSEQKRNSLSKTSIKYRLYR